MPLCPACDHDLAAFPPSWLTACPLRGQCPECAQTFDWRTLLNPRYATHPWSFEQSRRNLPRRFLLTSLATLFPPALWRAIRPDQPRNLPRLAILALAWPLLLHAAAMLAYRVMRRPDVILRIYPRDDTTSPWYPWSGQINFYARSAWQSPTLRRGLLMDVETSLLIILFPILGALLIVPPLLRRAPAHLLRVWLLSIPPAIILAVPHLLLMALVHAIEARLAAPDYTARPPVVWILYLVAATWHTVAMAAWWRSAFHRYFHHPRPGPLAIALLTILALAAVAAVQLAPRG